MASRRSEIAASYSTAFRDLPAIEIPTRLPGVSHAWHLYPIRLHLEQLRVDRARFIQELRNRQVGASVHFIPLHRQPFYAQRYGYHPGAFPVAEREFPRLISLPIYSRMTDDDVASVIWAVSDVVAHFQR